MYVHTIYRLRESEKKSGRKGPNWTNKFTCVCVTYVYCHNCFLLFYLRRYNWEIWTFPIDFYHKLIRNVTLISIETTITYNFDFRYFIDFCRGKNLQNPIERNHFHFSIDATAFNGNWHEFLSHRSNSKNWILQAKISIFYGRLFGKQNMVYFHMEILFREEIGTILFMVFNYEKKNSK